MSQTSNPDSVRKISLVCVTILETIDELRRMIVCDALDGHGDQSSQTLSIACVTSIMLTMLRDMNSLPIEKLKFYEIYEKDISDALGLLLDILDKSLKKVPNHFGVFESEKYKPDISSCKSFLGSLSRCANQYSEDNDKQTNYNLYKEIFRGRLQHMSLEAFSQNLRVALTDLPHLPARFFWLRSFGEQSSVSWEAFLTAFLADYQNENVGDNTENTEKKLLCSEVIDHFQEALRIVMQKQQRDDTQHTDFEQNKEVHQSPPVPLRATLPNGDSSGDDTVMLPDTMIDNSTEEHTAEKLQEDNVKCSAVTEDKVNHVESVPEVLSSPPEPHVASQDQSMSKSNEDHLLVLAKGDQFDHIHNSVTVDEPLPSFQITMNGFATFCGSLTAYGAFQAATDPCKVLLSVGQSNVSVPGVLRSMLGFDVKQVACGGLHVAVLTSSGKVFSWGKNSYGQLGLGVPGSVDTPRLVKLFDDQNIVCSKVACGFSYTGAITNQGGVYMWGCGENGRIGLGDERYRTVPTVVRNLRDVIIADIQLASVHSCFLTADGTLYTCGKHEYNGHGLKADLLSPRALPPVFFGVNTPLISQVAVNPGGYHSIALTSSNEVYTWGHNRCGQLGYYSFNNHDMEDSLVSPCGPLPRNYEGALFSPTPRRVFLQNSSIAGAQAQIAQVSAGWGHSSVLLSDGSVFSCGRNENGQLGIKRNTCKLNERGHSFQDHFQLVTGPFEADGVHAVVCGSEHSILLCRNGVVYGAGNIASFRIGEDSATDISYTEGFQRLDLGIHGACQAVIQASCGSSSTVFLLGQYHVPSLYSLCQNLMHSGEVNAEMKDVETSTVCLPHEKRASLPSEIVGSSEELPLEEQTH